MFTIETPNTFNKIIAILYYFRIWPKEDATSCNKTGWKLFHMVFFWSYIIAIAAGAFINDDTNESIYLTALVLASSVCGVKLVYIIFKRDKIISFIRDITQTVESREEFIQVNEKCKLSTNLLMCFPGVTTICIFVLLTTSLPVFTSEKRLPISIGFPLDWKNSEIAYWIAYAYLVVVATYISVITLFAIILWYVMLNYSIKYGILGNQFRNMGTIRSTQSLIGKLKVTKVQKQQLFHRDLLTAIKAHKRIVDTINEFMALFSNLFMAQITTSSISICGSIFVLVFTHQDLPHLVINSCSLCYYFFDIFIVMYLGDEIRDSSDRLSYCLFESNWIEQTKSSKNCIIILTEFLKQPHELVILKLYPLNLETFTRILRFSYSLINILQNFT